jgi:mono/diheme cytochrome c family protein
MKRKMFAALLLITALSPSTTTFAQKETVDVGKREFETHCAGCHGMDARGKGPNAISLGVAPPDLTLISKRNAGTFPTERIISVIDGRAQIESHGSREMPVWGDQYTSRAAEHFAGSPYDQEAFVRGRVLILVDYLSRIQQRFQR